MFRQGDAGEEAYLVVSGEIEILGAVGDGEHVVATLGAGELFGELALFAIGKRTASVRARRDATLAAIDYDRFRAIIATWPDAAMALLRVQTARFVTLGEAHRRLLAERTKPTPDEA